jgi:diacylglycerol kinase family enzyme
LSAAGRGFVAEPLLMGRIRPSKVVAVSVPGIGLITNPRSRAYRRDPAKPRKLGYLIGSAGTAEATQSLGDLYRVCEEFKKERIEILGISGGDGTLHHTLTAMIRTYGEEALPLIAILRGGTMNTVANSLHIRGETRDLLYELVDKHRRGQKGELEVFEKELLHVTATGDNGAGEDRYGFIFGNGVVYNFLHEYYTTGNPSPAVATRLILAAAASTLLRGPLSRRIYKRFKARVVSDGEEWACREFMTVAAAVVEQIGLGFRPFYRCDEEPGAFAILGIHTSAVGFVTELPRILGGQPMRRDKVIDRVARDVLFEPLEGDIEYIIDGDTYRSAGPVRLRTGPRLRFIRLTGQADWETDNPLPPTLLPEPIGSG